MVSVIHLKHSGQMTLYTSWNAVELYDGTKLDLATNIGTLYQSLQCFLELYGWNYPFISQPQMS